MTSPDWEHRLDLLRHHLRGFRRRLLSVFIAFGLGASLTFHFRHYVMAALFAPAHGMLSPTGQPIFTAPTEGFEFVIRMAVMGGFVAAVPVAIFHVASLARPLLNRKLRRFLAVFIPAASVLYLCGAAFAYWVLLPTGMRFLLSFGEGQVVAYIRVADYFDLATTLVLWLGVVFELPLAMLLLAKLDIVSYERMKKLRVYVPVAALILGAIITPTVDIVNQALVAVPLIVLYEVGMLLVWLARPRRTAGHRP